MIIIKQLTPLDAWIAATLHLIGTHSEDFNVLVSFPAESALDESPMRSFDPRTILGRHFESSRDVANTIFPSLTYRNAGTRTALYARYVRAHARGHNRSWGTYFLRLIDFGVTHVNQLENVIVALRGWARSHRAALLMHTSCASLDRLRPQGAPCLQYLQLSATDARRLDLLAVYRNHDFCNKVLGNYFGLSRLLNFICHEARMRAGQINCLSAHAYFSSSIRNQKRLAKIP